MQEAAAPSKRPESDIVGPSIVKRGTPDAQPAAEPSGTASGEEALPETLRNTQVGAKSEEEVSPTITACLEVLQMQRNTSF